jgi:8-amino-3,8-dideoxy-alpha-D-manno-octulosonate transaminase
MPGPGFEWFGKEEEEEVLDVLHGGWLFRYGDESNPAFKHKVRTLEETIEREFGVKHALALTSGTAALITALSALGIGPGDEVIVPGYTFIASISSIIVARATPVLAEIDDSLTLDPQDVERKITPRTKAIMAVHMLGNPCDIDKLRSICDKNGIPLIEDAAQATGATYKGTAVGTIGKIGVYSLTMKSYS